MNADKRNDLTHIIGAAIIAVAIIIGGIIIANSFKARYAKTIRSLYYERAYSETCQNGYFEMTTSEHYLCVASPE